MGINVSDIRRAILGAGDVSAFPEVCYQALGKALVLSISSLDTLVDLPQPMVLLELFFNTCKGLRSPKPAPLLDRSLKNA